MKKNCKKFKTQVTFGSLEKYNFSFQLMCKYFAADHVYNLHSTSSQIPWQNIILKFGTNGRGDTTLKKNTMLYNTKGWYPIFLIFAQIYVIHSSNNIMTFEKQLLFLRNYKSCIQTFSYTTNQ